jgi:hypothetical protein
MANGATARKIEDQTVVGLDLRITADAREDHLGPASETGEIVMSHGANGDQTSTLDGARVETQREPCPQIPDAHETGITAVVLDDADRPGQWTDKGCDGLRSDRRMGAICYQNGDRSIIDSGPVQAVDHDRKHLREARLPRRIRHDDSYVPASLGEIDQARAGEGSIEGGGREWSRVAT